MGSGSREMAQRASFIAEVCVLGGILTNPEALGKIPDLRPEHLEVPAHRMIYQAMLDASQAEGVDPVSICAHLEKRGALEQSGGMAAVLHLASQAVASVDIRRHVKTLQDAAQYRALGAIAQDVQQALGDRIDSPAEIREGALALLGDVRDEEQRAGMMSPDAGLRAMLDIVQAAQESEGDVPGRFTGFADLDELTAGLHPGELIVLGGRPAMGKTGLALNIARRGLWAEQRAGRPPRTTAIFSLEMPTAQLWQRVMAAEAQVPATHLRKGTLTPEEISRTLNTLSALQGTHIHIDDRAGATCARIKAECQALDRDSKSPPLGLVIIDYLQLMRGSGKARNREQEISEISRTLKEIAKELQVPIIALSQLSRGCEARQDKRPLASDLRESGAIEQDADVILFVYRDEVYHPDSPAKGIAEAIIRKNRSGSIGTARLAYDPDLQAFGDAPRGARP